MIKLPIFVLSVLLSSVVFSNAQISSEEANAVFDLIPLEQRSKLVARLNLFIELEKRKKWDESYEMISSSFKDRIQSGRPLKRGYPLEIYKDATNIKILKFTPVGIVPVSNETVYAAQPIIERKDHYFIEGCGKFRVDGSSSEALIEAYWENGDWYFSDMQLLGFEGGSACSHKKKK